MTKARDLANGASALSAVSATELGYLDGVTSAVQTQIDGKQAVNANVSTTELGYLDGVTSSIQTQLNAKQAVVSGVDDTEIGYLNGVTSAIQTQLNQKSEYVAGKNKIINGDFGIWQRGTSFSSATGLGYTADRWFLSWSGTTTIAVSRQTFTPGTAPVAGYESSHFARIARTAGSADDYFLQRIEDCRTFAGQTITASLRCTKCRQWWEWRSKWRRFFFWNCCHNILGKILNNIYIKLTYWNNHWHGKLC